MSLSLQLPDISAEDKQQLEELQQNLLQLFELSLDQLQQYQTTEAVATPSKPLNDNTIDDELALFQVCVW